MTSPRVGKTLSKEQSYKTLAAVAENQKWRGYFKPMQERGEHTHCQPGTEGGHSHFNGG